MRSCLFQRAHAYSNIGSSTSIDHRKKMGSSAERMSYFLHGGEGVKNERREQQGDVYGTSRGESMLHWFRR